MKLPTALAAVPMGAATRRAMPMPARTVTMGVTRMSILVSFATSLPHSAATMATTYTASGPARAAHSVGGKAHGDQGKQHQRRAVQRKSDGHGNAGATMAEARPPMV